VIEPNGERSFLVSPDGSASAALVDLEPAALKARPIPSTVHLDALAMARTGTPLGAVLDGLRAGRPLPGMALAREGPTLQPTLWTATGPGRTVQATPMARTARRAGALWPPRRERFGLASALAVAIGAAIVSAATGSLRAIVVVIGGGLALAHARPEAFSSIGTAPGVALGVAVAALLEPRIERRSSRVRTFGWAALVAATALTGAILAAAAMNPGAATAAGRHGAFALAVTLALSALLLPTLGRLPGRATVPLERPPIAAIVVAAAAIGLGGLALVPRPAEATLIARGAHNLDTRTLARSLRRCADVARAHGADTVLAAVDDGGAVQLILSGRRAAAAARAVTDRAPRGLGLLAAGTAILPARSRPGLADRSASPNEVEQAAALLTGPIRADGNVIRLLDRSAGGLLPLRAADGGLIYARELGLAPGALLTRPPARPQITPTGPPTRSLVVVTLTALLAASIVPLMAARRRGASHRIAWREASSAVLRLSGAGVAGAVAYGSTIDAGRSLAALAVCWAGVLLVAAAPARLARTRSTALKRI